MKRFCVLSMAAVLAAVALPAGAQESAKAMDLHQQALKAMFKCGSDYGRKSAKIAAMANEIADAARSVCADQYSDAEITLQNWSRVRLIERGARSEAALINAGAADVAEMAALFRRFIISEVIAERTETAK